MLSMAKIVGDLMQGYAIHITGGIFAIIVGSEVYDHLVRFADPVTTALNVK